MRKQEEIRSLYDAGYSIRSIARALNISRQTVRKCLTEPGNEEAAEWASAGEWQGSLDWAELFRLSKAGVSIAQLHQEYAPDISYWSFWYHLKKGAPSTKQTSLRKQHKPGAETELDYADGIGIINPRTGEITKTHLYCGVLAFSGYVFGEFVLSQKLSSFIGSQERMWQFFGGVTPYVVVDNLKAGVARAHRYDPDVNPTYCEYGRHAGFVVLPARPYKPKDKARVEGTIGVIRRQFYQEVRNHEFYSLAELNDAFRRYLERLNSANMKDYDVSRKERFQIEAPLLKKAPETRFEITEQKTAKVHPDCHIQVHRNFYSVPFQNVGQVVRVRIKEKMVEVFSDDGALIAVHARLTGKGRFSTDLRHYPEERRGVGRFELKYAQMEAQKIGPYTTQLVKSLINANYPLQYLRRIQGILRLVKSKRVSCRSMEYACAQALLFNKPRLAYIKDCAEHFEANGGRPKPVAPLREPQSLFLHEPEVQNER